MTRVFHLASDLGPNGVAKQLSLVACGLRERSIDQLVGVLGEDFPFSGSLEASGVEVRRVPVRHAIDVPGVRSVARAIADFAPDVLHAWGVHASRLSTLFRLAGWIKRRGPRVLVTGPTNLMPCVGRGQGAPNPIEFRRSLGLPESSRLVVAAGQFDNRSGLRNAIWAFDILKVAVPGTYLVLAGDGPGRGRMARFSLALGTNDDRVRYVGTRSDLSGLMGLAEVVWVTHAHGGMNIALEAMAAGAPVVAFANTDLIRLIADGETGRLVPAGDRVGLAAVTGDLFENPPARAAMAAAARAAVAARFTVGPVVDQYLSQYHDLIPAGR